MWPWLEGAFGACLETLDWPSGSGGPETPIRDFCADLVNVQRHVPGTLLRASVRRGGTCEMVVD